MYFTAQTIKKAICDMRGSADHMLKIWFVLKAMGLTKVKNVTINTENSTPYLKKLFRRGSKDGSFFVPFAHTPRFATMQEDAARSIIQTNCKKWIDRTVTGADPTSFLTFKETDVGISVGVSRQYPLGLGYNIAGFARKDGQRVSVPDLQFAVWLFAQTNLDSPASADIIAQMKKELNLDDSEYSLIFIRKDIDLQFQDTPISDSDLNNICSSAFNDAITQEIKLEAEADYIKRVKNMVTISEKPAWITISPEAQLEKLIHQGEKAILLSGPPRTGKTRAIDKIVPRTDSARCTIQLHEGWSYENLIFGWYPKQGSSGFEPREGVLLKALRANKKVIVLEEVNRTHLSQALGELFSLLETAYRGEASAISLPDSSSIFIPKDTLFLFTMNTIDASTEDIDDALVGRMASVAFPPRIEDLNSILVAKGIPEEDKENIKSVFNMILANYPLGHGYFANYKKDADFKIYYLSRIRPVLCNHFESFKPEVIAQIDNFVDSLFNVEG